MLKTIHFDEQCSAVAVRVDARQPPQQTLAALHMPAYRGIVVTHGGAVGMEDELVTALQGFLTASLAPFAQEHHILLVDGGTQVGVPRAMGDARRAVHGTYPLLGVCPHRFATYPGGPSPSPDRFPLDPWHSHFILVEGDAFGVESDLMVSLLDVDERPGVALIINGGDLVSDEAQQHARLAHTLITINGSGRIADELADPHSVRRAALPSGTHLEVVDIGAPERLVGLLERLLLA
jgi:hypothetical protein